MTTLQKSGTIPVGNTNTNVSGVTPILKQPTMQPSPQVSPQINTPLNPNINNVPPLTQSTNILSNSNTFYQPPSMNFPSQGPNNNMHLRNTPEDIKRSTQGNRIVFDSRFNSMCEVEPINHAQVVRLRRSFWYGFNRGDYHPSMSNYRMLYNEFNIIMNSIDNFTDQFRTIRVLYIFLVTFFICAIITFITGVYFLPSYKKTEAASLLREKHISAVFMIIGLAICLVSSLLFISLILYYLKRYQRILKRQFKEGIFYTYERKNIYFKIGKLCNFVEIKFIPISNYQLWLNQNYVPNPDDDQKSPNQADYKDMSIRNKDLSGSKEAALIRKATGSTTPPVQRKKKFLCF
jgi:hypothetical protein